MTKTENAKQMDAIKDLADDICYGQDGCRECPLHRLAADQENLCVYLEKAQMMAKRLAQEEQRRKK